MRIYLAGKISKTNDWRASILGPDRPAMTLADSWGDGWPILERAILGTHDCVGPFFTSCDHGCAHGRSSHGVGAWFDGAHDRATCIDDTAPSRAAVVARCRGAIAQADLMFAWLSTHDAFGSIYELGIADALNVPIVIASPRGFNARDLWFAYAGADEVIVDAESPHAALVTALSTRADVPRARVLTTSISNDVERAWANHARLLCESPIELAMLDALAPYFPTRTHSPFGESAASGGAGKLTQQHEASAAGRYYRLDFAIVGAKKIAIECDGHAFHDATPEQAERDKSRDRALLADGWQTLRFTGREINRDAAKCAAQVIAFAMGGR